jgi:hypothetical protein
MSRRSAFVVAVAWAIVACDGPVPASRKGAESPRPPSATAPAAYTYPAPVKGHYKEINTGSFDLTDGIA